jgi:hypothetical protein
MHAGNGIEVILMSELGHFDKTQAEHNESGLPPKATSERTSHFDVKCHHLP